MKSAQIPANEMARLEALRRYQILDTLPEPVFDELTNLAAIVCEVPVATITLIDKDREWFKSKFGITDEQAARDISLCAHTILEKELLIVPDTLEDERFFDNPFVLDNPPLRFYAAVPLITPDGFALGTICVIDHVPRKLTDSQINALKVLANLIMLQLEHHSTMLKYAERKLDLYDHIVSGTSDFMSFIDCNYTYQVINEAYLKLFNKRRDEIVGHTLADLFGEDFFQTHQKPKFDLALTGQKSGYEAWIDLPAYGRRYFIVDYTPFKEDGRVIGVVVSARDITERKQAEESQHELNMALANAMPGISRLNSGGQYITLNDSYAAMLGNRPEDLIGQPWTSTVHPDDMPQALAAYKQTVKEGQGEFEARAIRKDGSLIFKQVLMVKSLDNNGVMTGHHCFMRDITDRKKTEKEILQSRERLRNLAGRLQEIREEERTIISREIHDEVGQTLTGLSIDMAWILKKLSPGQHAIAERTRKCLQLVDETLAAMHRIAHDLRPAILDDMGLKAAIELQMEEFLSKTGCQYELKLDADNIGLNQPRDTTLFRILQETLTNISRHALASCVYVHLKTRGDELILDIKDNGVGISEEQITSSRSIGLVGMRERAGDLGGNVNISRMAGGGTQVLLKVPLAGNHTHQ